MELTFKLSEQETQSIFNLLSKEPYVVVFELIEKMQLQVNEQMKATVTE